MQSYEGNKVQYSVTGVIKGEILVLGAPAGQVPNPLLSGLGSFHAAAAVNNR